MSLDDSCLNVNGPIRLSAGEYYKSIPAKTNPLLISGGSTLEIKTEGLKDSGERKTFSTGAVRDAGSGKGKPSLVPNFVIWLVSRIYEDGAAKYASRNWEKGMPLSQYLDSAERHIAKLKCGMRDEPHASQALWNIIGYVYTSTLIKLGMRPKELNDMPNQTAPLNDKGEVPVAEPLAPHEYKSLKYFFDVKGEFPVTF